MSTLPGKKTERDRWAKRKAREDRDIYARKGEVVTCTNGHPIFRFKRHVRYGFTPVSEDTCGWTQRKLHHGDPITNCAICGAKYAVNHHAFGFLCFIKGEWRIENADLRKILTP